ncbi:RloB family protein [Kitasatospora sp. NPDC059673]|uniref:RloB family protein n=1 Tax=Kitasatospora sp. NPDC059673 TaxID=3346901 RepID=UPI0036966876
MRRGKSLQRGKSTRAEQRRFLIYCEGECTESMYFKGLRSDLKSLPVTICLGADHGEPKSLVRAAISHKDRAPFTAADRYTAYDEVWCVVDVEAPKAHPSLDEALVLARRAGVKVALTNPCFEFWLLLHLHNLTSYQTTAAAQTALEKSGVCGYSAQRKHLDYVGLRGPGDERYMNARERAGRLRARSEDAHRTNPWTNVDELVDLLRDARGV